ncbi:DedA family protein [Paenibacillus sp. 1011MAR3C5]|uniref:YqaA family protein n=1 Tax=Paenibacillus sp. 1011MAR3C5 TaxID=1675787 RepID=UPI000E6B8325|nr:VTT domain-containing protein [Paenibacillus sp. 1011MAR3C5]RJE86912.1 DedA family protein [Paenibacillus sp. 1011MAR3C5]
MIEDIVDYVLNYGDWGLFIHSFADAVIFPIPALFTQVSLSLLDPSNALWLATLGFIGCLVGTPFGYWIGKGLGHTVMNRMLKKSWVDAASRMIQKNGEAAILIGSFTPIPFKVFTILSGCLNFPLWRLMAYAAIGRAAKFYIVGLLFYLYGRSAEGMVKDVSLYLLLGVVPIVLIIVLIRKRKKRKADQTAILQEGQQEQQGQEVSS